MKSSDLQPAIERQRAVRVSNLAALIRLSSRELKEAVHTRRPASEIAAIRSRRDAYFQLLKDMS